MSIFSLDLDFTDPAWGYLLAQRFITAALACGFECDRTFVADGQYVEGPPPSTNCECQLAVIVTTGIDSPDDADDPFCLPVFTANIVLVVDLCVLVADANSVLTPTQYNDRARLNQEALWRIMQGLMQARSNNSLGGTGRFMVGGWQGVSHIGGSARWQTAWAYRQ